MQDALIRQPSFCVGGGCSRHSAAVQQGCSRGGAAAGSTAYLGLGGLLLPLHTPEVEVHDSAGLFMGFWGVWGWAGLLRLRSKRLVRQADKWKPPCEAVQLG